MIKTGRVRRTFDEALETKRICPNMLFMSLAALQNLLDYDEKLSDVVVVKYQNHRKLLAQCAIQHGIDKSEIADKIKRISFERYPSSNQLTKLTDIVEQGDYIYVANEAESKCYIADSDLIYMSEAELQEKKNRPKIVRDKIKLQVEREFHELCLYVETDIMFCSLTEDMKALLRKSRTDEYTYEVILKTFQRHRNEIIDSSRKEFVSQYLKLKYILGIVDRKIPDVLSLCQKQHEAQRNNREIAASLELTVEEAEELSKYFGNVSIESINVLVDFNEVGANAKTVLNLLRENGVGSYDQYDDLRRKCDDWYSRTEMKYDYSDYLKAFVAGEDALNRLIEDAKAESQKSKEEWAERCKSKIKPVQSSRYDDLW